MSVGIDRRRFLKVLGVTGGAAAAEACGTDRVEKLIPHLVPPEQEVPGVATWYASTCRECPGGCGLHVRVREGRAVKLEGNQGSPVNRGRLCARGQAGLQGLYHPDRLRGPMAKAQDGGLVPISWDDALARLGEALGSATGAVAFVTGGETGSFGALVDQWLALFPSSHRVTYEPLGFEALREANRITFGRAVVPQYDFAAARYVLSFGADFLETWLNPTTNTLGYASGHAFRDGRMGTCVYVDQRMGLTGINADEWVAPVPGSETLLALALVRLALEQRQGRAPADAERLRTVVEPFTPAAAAAASGVPVETIERIAREFGAADGALAVAGGAGAQAADQLELCVAANLLNYVTGNVGRTVRFGPNLGLDGLSPYRAVVALVDQMAAGAVGVALVHGANPGHTFPDGVRWREAFARVPFKVAFATVPDETARDCDLLLPDHHPLEQWADSQPVAGVLALQQPVMTPVFDTRQTGDVLLAAAQALGRGSFPATFKDYVRERWRARAPAGADAEQSWRDALAAGGLYTEAPVESVVLSPEVARFRFRTELAAPLGSLLAVAVPTSLLYDGRGADKPWLQEVPDPVTKVTWHTWVEMHPETAAGLGVVTGDIVDLVTAGGSLEAPALVYDAIRPGVVVIPLGQGHESYGRYASGRGANAFRLLAVEPAASGGLKFAATLSAVRATGRHRRLATTEGSPRQHGREIARVLPLAAALGGEAGAPHGDEHVLWGQREQAAVEGWAEAQKELATRGSYVGEHPRWAMVIDLARCTGCSACVAACYAENNIPVVGESGVLRGREMAWLRIERFWEGEHGDAPHATLIPMLCQHCGNAPCEPVCPVFAAYHTPDGLNAQVYNRCVGTRYCANNCPYKVRYFNWFDYSGETPGPYDSFPEPLNWQLNPDVTVRTKGVMEKCTFCVQRIREKQHRARLADRPLADGEILTACQQTCPAEAIVFGDLNDQRSAVHRAAGDPRGYQVFAELNTRPAITYLARVTHRAEA